MKRLRPYIDKGIANGIFVDDSPIVSLWKTKAKDPQHEKVIKDLGGLKQEVAQNFVTDTVLVDLSAILRKERYTAHLEVWEVKHTTVGLAKGNPRPACFMMGQAVVEDGEACRCTAKVHYKDAFFVIVGISIASQFGRRF